MVGDGQSLMNIVIGNQDANVLLFQFGDNSLYILHGNGVHTGKRFVQKDELRVGSQTTGNFRTSSLTS